MERATKLIVVCWASAALAVEVLMVNAAWGALLPLSVAAFITAAVLTAIDRRLVGVVLALTYVFPALIYAFYNVWHIQFGSVWMAALLGSIVPASIRTPWSIPKPWRGPLVCWALVVVTGSSIVFAREFDFTTATLNAPYLSNSPVGGNPSSVGSWVLYVGLVLVLGILWFDWLFGVRERDFHMAVAAPLAVSCLAMAAVSAYQLFGDLSFLNTTVFGAIGRASGTLFDANICGTIAALWIGGAMLLAQRAGRWGPYLVAVGVPIAWLAVWASGSRTAFASATLITLVAIVAGCVRYRTSPLRVTLVQLFLVVGIVAGLAALVAHANPAVVGPMKRVWATLPSPSAESVRAFTAEMWNRNRYGSAATSMISDFPLFGVGVGSFQTLLPQYAQGSGGLLPPDNAQNWYRHQFAEFGLIGSLAWIAWVIGFAWFLFTKRPARSALVSVWVGRGILLSFALISLLGMPSQDVAVSITFWTMASWYVLLVGSRERRAPLGWRTWAAIAAVVIVYAVGTASVAATSLRVPIRAQRVGWPYSYGFYGPEADGSGQEFRWTARRAVTVLEAPAEWLALTISANHRDLGTNPVDVKVWRDRELVLRSRLRTTNPVTQYVRVPRGEQRVLLETWVSRVMRPSDSGAQDTRELGVMVQWHFVDAPK